MNGPEHYREAERLLDLSRAVSLDGGHATYLANAAQVHATLAQVAATVDALRGEGRAWREVTR